MQNTLSPASTGARLFLLGFLTLFLELAFIRYLPSTIWNLGYFPNLVLVAVFIGMGTGFIFHKRFSWEQSKLIFQKVPLVFLIMMSVLMAFRPQLPGFDDGLGKVGQEIYFTTNAEGSGFLGYFLFLIWFLQIALIFAMISQLTAKYFSQLSPLKAYTYDILGSCMGILSFILISCFQIRAGFWFLLLVPLVLYLADYASSLRKWSGFAFLLLGTFMIFAQDSQWIQHVKGYKDIAEFIWSPYQLVKYRAGTLFVNGIAHQEIANPQSISGTFYQMPYTERSHAPDLPPYKEILVIGAGSGNDVTTALQNGVRHVDAVEIDPAIAQFGKLYNTGHPYEDSRVTVTIDDGRAFLTRAQKKYDLIILALTDSLVKVSPMAQLRLENFLFTRETVERAYSLLNPSGSLVFYNYYRTDWLIDRLQKLLYEGSGGNTPRILWKKGDFAVMIVTKNGTAAASSQPPHSDQAVAFQPNSNLELPSDDWPFLYLEKRSIPPMYFFAMLTFFSTVIVLVYFMRARRIKLAEDHQPFFTKAAFALMGMAFLLLETKSIIQFSLLFGTTWVNSSLVFLAILVSVLLANWTAQWFRSSKVLWVAFGLLLFSCFVTFLYPISNLLYFEDRFLRFILASALTFSPIYFANLIFSASFKDQKSAESLFGWNLIGATLGGVTEYFSMVVGYHSLTLLVGCCYAVAFLLLFQRNRGLKGRGGTLSCHAPQ